GAGRSARTRRCRRPAPAFGRGGTLGVAGALGAIGVGLGTLRGGAVPWEGWFLAEDGAAWGAPKLTSRKRPATPMATNAAEQQGESHPNGALSRPVRRSSAGNRHPSRFRWTLARMGGRPC